MVPDAFRCSSQILLRQFGEVAGFPCRVEHFRSRFLFPVLRVEEFGELNQKISPGQTVGERLP